MRPANLSLVALAAALAAAGCESVPADKPSNINTFRSYAAGERARGTLSMRSEPGHLHMAAVTQLDDGTCLAEEVSTDRVGRVVRAESTLTGEAGTTRVVFDAQHGSVDVRAPHLQIRWTVPNDLPWVWTSMLSDRVSGAPLATPVGVILAARAASVSHAVRTLDLESFQSPTLMADQMLVAESDAVTVVLGDDAARVVDGLPQRIHLAAWGGDLEVRDAELPWETALAAFSCARHDRSRTL